ncbi:CAAD domain-containing protein [Prochlorococcus sp. MIT 1223]|uniref:CAAD domain-containing protein n=1 Tax=Prochlorococcus sp. MIT 1223 TaxID=3096217 RepID=UPI002A7487FF|nr:CAAD domain-containing protein [Prochlorococcus sp. MIT 1223]
MSDAPSESKEGSNTTQGSGFSERSGEVMNKLNETLSKIDWTQMGKYGKAAGIVAIVILAQVLIKIVIDTINFFPILPGLLELLGVVVLCQWCWQNLTTSEKRNAVVEKVQNLRQEYLG